MSRIKRGVTTRQKHKRILEQAKGYRGRRKNTIRVARQAVEKAGQYAYRDRKVKKGLSAPVDPAINAAVARGLTFAFHHGAKRAGSSSPRRSGIPGDERIHGFRLDIQQAKEHCQLSLPCGHMQGRGWQGLPRLVSSVAAR